VKRLLCLTALTLAAGAAFAHPLPKGEYVLAEVKALEAEYGARDFGTLKVSELVPAAGRLDVARQKDGFVLGATVMSVLWPGAGQFASGDIGGGALQTGLHLGVVGATLVGVNAVLPSDLRVGNLDYLGSPQNTVDNAWKAHKLSDFYPAFGVMMAGTAVDFALRFWSARDAQVTAKKAIDEGRVTFEPRFDQGAFGFGMRY